jgi:prevent-host-death family protein
MPAKKDVRPITHLKSKTAELVREVCEEGRPVTITQNGVAKVVVMDVETYDRWRAAMALLKALAQGEADLERGRTVKQADALRRARRAIERAARDG